MRDYLSPGLLGAPASARGFRVHSTAAIARIAFIKRAQARGFTLDEVRSMLNLEDGRNQRAIQSVTEAWLGQIEDKLTDLQRMCRVLADMLSRCTQTALTEACPIIKSLTGARALRVRRVAAAASSGRSGSMSSGMRTCGLNAPSVGARPTRAREARGHVPEAGMSAMSWSADLPP